MIIRPQPGPQEAFLSHGADVVFYGGGAGSGKTFSLLMDPLRFLGSVRGFTGVIFRRTYPEITNPGGLWDESRDLYPHAGGTPNRGDVLWTFKKDSWIKFSHMQHEDNVYSWQGSQIAYIGFDELTHFSEKVFFYMLSRNRSICGVRPYIRATMNPDPDSWVREFISWWLDDNGYPITERSGVVRYFTRHKGQVLWADTPELITLLGLRPKSFTFIPALVHDNKIMLERDPDYLANLQALVSHERDRLLFGNWNARATAGSMFKRSWFSIVDAVPADCDSEVVYWDRASTEPSENSPDPDYTCGVRMAVKDGIYYVKNVYRDRVSPQRVERMIRSAAEENENATTWLEQDPGQAGVNDVGYLLRALAGYPARAHRVTKAKEERARPCSSQCEAGNVRLLRGRWNDAFLNELEGFPLPNDKGHVDQVDALSGAFNALAMRNTPRISQG